MKRCLKCKVDRNEEEFHKNARMKDGLNQYCKVCFSAISHDSYILNREKILSRQKLYREEFKDKTALASKNSLKKLKVLVFSHYGVAGEVRCSWPQCQQREIAALVIDHKDGNGGVHRKVIRKNVWFWLKENNFPEGFQTLCRNHNRIKQHEKGEFSKGRPKLEGGSERLIRQRVAQARFRAEHDGVDKAYREKLKIEVCTHYGRDGQLKCSWEGCEWTDLRVLTIDHVNNDGAVHRKEIGGGGATLYAWLIEHEFPEGFQTLCEDHQWLKKAAILK